MPKNVTPTTIAAALLDRGTALRPGLEDFDASGLAAIGVERLHDDFVAMMRCFDGFVAMDAGHIQIWDIATILTEQDGPIDPPGLIAFGDFLIFSDIILCDPSDPSRPVVYRFEGRELAPTYWAFWERLVAGEFDLPSMGG